MHCNSDNSYLFLNGKEIYKFKGNNKNGNFPSQFCPRSKSNQFNCVDSEEVSLKGNVYDFSVNYGFIDKSDIMKIDKYLMSRNNIKSCLAYLLYY